MTSTPPPTPPTDDLTDPTLTDPTLTDDLTAQKYADRIRARGKTWCHDRRNPESYPLVNGGTFTPPPSCEGYYERGLRCPECPEEMAEEFASVIENGE